MRELLMNNPERHDFSKWVIDEAVNNPTQYSGSAELPGPKQKKYILVWERGSKNQPE
ncbi:MAG: hypothetical protein WBA22_19045 [Candidatus Methanofastidiosia archaeon]